MKVNEMYQKCSDFIRVSAERQPWAVHFDLMGLQHCIHDGMIQTDFPQRHHVHHAFYEWESWKHWSDHLSKKIRDDILERSQDGGQGGLGLGLMRVRGQLVSPHPLPAVLDIDDDKKFRYWAKVAYVYIVATFATMLEVSSKEIFQ